MTSVQILDEWSGEGEHILTLGQKSILNQTTVSYVKSKQFPSIW